MDDRDHKGFVKFIKEWAFKKMMKLEKKLLYYANIYYGEPMVIVYARSGAKIVHADGSESVLLAYDEAERGQVRIEKI